MALGDPSKGSAGNVQGADPGFEADKEGLAGMWQQVTGRARKADGPNAAAYNSQMEHSQGNANAYGDRGLNYTQDAAQINNQFREGDRSDVDSAAGQQRYLAQNMRDIQEGKDTTGAKAMIQAGTDQTIAAQMNMARSAKGGAVGQAGASRQAMQQAALSQAGVASQAGQLQASLAMQAAQVESQTRASIANTMMQKYGMSQQEAMHQADLVATNQSQQNAMRLGYGALGNQAQGQSLGALDAYTGKNLQAQGLGQAGAAADSASTGQTIGTIAGVAAMAMSDVNAKTAVHQEGFRQGMQAGRTTALDYQEGNVGQSAQVPKGEQPSYGRDTYGGPGGSAPAAQQQPAAQSSYEPPTSSYAAALSPQAMAPSPASPAYQQVAQPALADLPSVKSSAGQMAQAATKASPSQEAALPGAQAPSAANNAASASQMASRPQAGLASFMSDEASKLIAESQSSTDDAIRRSMSSDVDIPKIDMGAFQKDTFKDVTSKYKDRSPKKTAVDDVAAGRGDTTLPDYTPMSGGATAPTDAGALGTSAPAGTNTPSWMNSYMAGQGSSAAPAMAGAAEAGAFESDRRAKDVDKKHTLADDFLDGIHPLSFHYKELQDEPRPHPNGGKYLGVTAQDLERVPEVGPQLVENTPRGKQVVIKATLSAALAGMARLNERVRHLEGKGSNGR